jgi:hypothetical protein
MLFRLEANSMIKSVFLAGVVLLCLGVAINVFLFLISLPGGPGTQQPFDWILILTSLAPAYLPWKIPIVQYVVAAVLMIVGLVARPQRHQQ